MPIEEAIEMLEAILLDRQLVGKCMGDDAIQLGIEALKRVKEARKTVYFTTRKLLPGETKE